MGGYTQPSGDYSQTTGGYTQTPYENTGYQMGNESDTIDYEGYRNTLRYGGSNATMTDENLSDIYQSYPFYQQAGGDWNVVLENIEFPTDLFICPNKDVRTARTISNFSEDDYAEITYKVLEMYDIISQNSTDLVASARFSGCIIRAAGHDLMDYTVNYYGQEVGGSDGCMNFNDPDNDGLINCLIYNRFVEIYAQVCHLVSLADFFVVASEATMIRGHSDFDPNNVFGE